MSLEQIQSAMNALVAQMLAKGVVTPKAEFIVCANETFALHLQSDYNSRCLNGEWLKTKIAATPGELITWGNDFVSGLKSAEEKVLRTYLVKLADAVDYGHINGIAAEYVDPVRITQKAMTENLLSAPAVDAAEPARVTA